MATNLSLNTRIPHKNGTVSFDSIDTNGQQSLPAGEVSNSSRVKNLFNDKFTGQNSFNITKKMFEGKKGLSSSSDFINSDRSISIRETIENLNNSRNDSNSAVVDQKIASLSKELSIIEALQASAFEIEVDESADSAIEDFNPDFPIGSVSFSYNKTLNRHAEDLGKPGEVLSLTGLSPNIAHPVGGRAETSFGPRDGGFGNDKNEKSIADGLIDSVQFSGKYVE